MYCELHTHSGFSFLDGTTPPEQLVLAAVNLGYPALALTDHHGLYGSMAFAQAAKQHGIQAITGAELTLLDGAHVTLLAETPTGYANLCRLITEAHLGREDRRDPRLDWLKRYEPVATPGEVFYVYDLRSNSPAPSSGTPGCPVR